MSQSSVQSKKFFPDKQIGGSMEFLDGWGESFAEGSKKVVTESASTITEGIVDLFKQDIAVKSTENSQKTQIGGQTELKFNQQKQEDQLKEKMRVEQHKRQLFGEQKQQADQDARKKAMAQQRENVIKTVGGISNTSYEDVMDQTGRLRVDIEAWFNKKNSEMNEADIKRQKQSQMAQATGTGKGGFKMGENELGLGGENKQHFTNVAG